METANQLFKFLTANTPRLYSIKNNWEVKQSHFFEITRRNKLDCDLTLDRT